MATLDPAVASVLDRSAADHRPSFSSEQDEDALFDQLEKDSETHIDTAFRERRLQQLKAELSRARDLRAAGAGTYQEVKDEKTLLDITTSTKSCVVHFFKPDFNRCRIMDGHLEVSSSPTRNYFLSKMNLGN